MVALEDRFQTTIDETAFSGVKSVADLESLVRAPAAAVESSDAVDFPRWNRSAPVRLLRRVSLATWILPLARVFARIRVEGAEHLERLDGPVVFASNHQSHFDTPVILAAMRGRVRARVAVAMAKEFFKAHFFPQEHTALAVVHQQPQLLSRRDRSSTRSRCPSAKRGRATPCVTSARCSAPASRC